MNKQLINKYKPEFDHWLNEGSLLMSNKNTKVWITLTVNTWACTAPSVDHLLIVINDEYVEFRKALAEGKTVQANVNYWSFPETEEFNWQDIASPDSFNKFNLLNLRIKPDEPKFKVGDFVTPLNREINCSIWKIDKVLSCNTLVSGSTMLDPRTIKPWTPVKGEWCWFCDNKSSKSAALAKFNKINNNYFISITDMHWQFCEPFLNSIPSYLKDK